MGASFRNRATLGEGWAIADAVIQADDWMVY